MHQPGSEGPPLSVVVACCEPWPELEPCLDALWDQACAAGAEVVVGDGDGDALPPDAETRFPGLRRVVEHGASPLRLRFLGVEAARGEIVAITEDHCRPAPDWCAAAIAAHRAHPEAAAIGGSVENGATDRLIDWASFFIAHGPFLPPVGSGERTSIALQANVTYKRAALAALPPPPEGEMMELHVNNALRAQGRVLRVEDSLRAVHDQSLGARGTSAGHFHNGRSIAGLRIAYASPWERLWRGAGVLALPLVLTTRSSRAVLSRRCYRATLVKALPAMLWLTCCHAAGELVGSVAGPGDSPSRLD